MLYEDRSSIARNVWLLGNVGFWARLCENAVNDMIPLRFGRRIR